jgi:hypothetical protein
MIMRWTSLVPPRTARSRCPRACPRGALPVIDTTAFLAAAAWELHETVRKVYVVF